MLWTPSELHINRFKVECKLKSQQALKEVGIVYAKGVMDIEGRIKTIEDFVSLELRMLGKRALGNVLSNIVLPKVELGVICTSWVASCPIVNDNLVWEVEFEDDQIKRY